MRNGISRKLTGLLCSIIILAAANSVLLWQIVSLSNIIKAATTAGCGIFTLLFIIIGSGMKSESRKLKRLSSGSFILGCGIFMSIAEIAVIIFAIGKNGWIRNLIGILTAELVITIFCLGGIVRIAASARQFKVLRIIALFCLWYVPVINIFVFASFYRSARH